MAKQEPSASPKSNEIHGEIIQGRRQYCEQAISGAAALFSPWSQTPGLAAKSFSTTLKMALDTFDAQPLSKKNHVSLMPRLALLLAKRASLFDEQLMKSMRSKPSVDLWRSLIADAYLECCAELDGKEKLTLCSTAPLWLVQSVIAKTPIDDSARWAAAIQLIQKQSNFEKLEHSLACIPDSGTLFSPVPALGGHSLCSLLTTSRYSLHVLKSQTLVRFPKSMSFPDSYAESAIRDIRCGFWDIGMDSVARHFKPIVNPYYEDTASAAAYLFAGPSEKIRAPKYQPLFDEWIKSAFSGSIKNQDGLYLALICPSDNLDFCCRVLSKACAPNRNVLHALLLRLSGSPMERRGIILESTSAMVDQLGAQALGASARSEDGNAKNLCANAYELAIRAAIENKTRADAAEASPYRDLLSKLGSLGFDPEAPTSGKSKTGFSGPSCLEKLRASKSMEGKTWLALAEAHAISFSIGSAGQVAGLGRAPRL